MYDQFSRNVPVLLYDASIRVCAAMQNLYRLIYGFLYPIDVHLTLASSLLVYYE